MVNSFTSGKGRLVQPPYGSYVDEWQKPVNSDFGLVDALISGTTTLNVSSLTPSSPFFTLVFQDFDTSQTPWLNPLAGQNMRVVITGALSYNVTIFIPSNYPGVWIIDNQTTGPFSVTVLTTAAGSSGVAPTQGFMSTIFSDGTNVKYADLGTVKSVAVPVATSTTQGTVTQGFLPGNCVNLDSQGKIPFQTDKYIISTGDPDPAQGSQDWLWMKV
jgi:hypothetical protein